MKFIIACIALFGITQVVVNIDIKIRGSRYYSIPGEPFTFTCTFNSTIYTPRHLLRNGVKVQSLQFSEGICYDVKPFKPKLCNTSSCSCSQQGDIFTASWTFSSVNETSQWICKEGIFRSLPLNLTTAVPVTSVRLQSQSATQVLVFVDQKENISCVASESRPKTYIQWYIGSVNFTGSSKPTVRYIGSDNFTGSSEPKVIDKTDQRTSVTVSNLIFNATKALDNKTISCRAWNIDTTRYVELDHTYTLVVQGSTPVTALIAPISCASPVLSFTGENGICILWIIVAAGSLVPF